MQQNSRKMLVLWLFWNFFGLKTDIDVNLPSSKVKWFRRVATRYDKLDKSFLAFVYMAAIMIWLL